MASRTMLRRIVNLSVLLVALAVGNAAFQKCFAQQKQNFNVIEPGYLTIAIYGNVIPSAGATPDGQPDGIHGAVLTKVAETYGLKPKVFQTNFAGAITAVQQKRSDVGVSTYWNEQRSKALYFTDATHLNFLFWALKKTTPYTGAESLKGKIVGSTTGYAHNDYFKKVFGDKFREFPGDAQGIQAVSNGQIDAFNSGIALAHRTRDNADLKVVELNKGDFDIPPDLFVNPVRMYVACDNKPLGDAVTAVIAQMKKDGALKAVIQRFYTGPGEIISPVDVPKDNCGS